MQTRLEEVLLELAGWLHERTGDRDLVMAGGVALNCVADSRLWREGPFERIWVQPAAGDSGTALGAALHVAHALGDTVAPMPTAALGRGWDDAALAARLRTAGVAFERPPDVADVVAEALAADQVVAWFQGRSEFGPRAWGIARSWPTRTAANLEKLNDIKGREQFRPVAPMVLAERAAEIFAGGPIPTPFMLFTHDVVPGWAERIPAVVHVDGTARIQTVDRHQEPLMARCLERFEARPACPWSSTPASTPPAARWSTIRATRSSCFGSAPVDLLAIGPFVLRRAGVAAAPVRRAA